MTSRLIGDLIATCTSTLSRNHTLGRRLATGEDVSVIQEDMHMVAEGVNTTVAVHRHAARLGVDMPITEAMHQVLFEQADIPDVIQSLMTRTSVYESDYTAIRAPGYVSSSVVEHAARIEAAARGDSAEDGG